jgi:nitroreductase
MGASAPNPCIARLLEAARLAPSADNSQPWQLRVRDGGLRVEYDDARAGAQGFGPRDPATLLAMGALIETVLAAADEMDLALTVVTSPGDGQPPWYLDARLDDAAAGCAEPPREHPLWRRHTNRFGSHATALPGALTAALAAMSARDLAAGADSASARVRVIEHPSRVRAAADLVRRGSRLRFRVRELHEWLTASLRLTPRAAAGGDGLDAATLDLPPGGGRLLALTSDWQRMRRLNRLGLYRLLAAADSAPVAKAPALVLISGAADGPSALAAGRLLAQVWHRLQDAGIACHPYYVISDMITRLRDGRLPDALLPEAEALRTDSARVLRLAPGEQPYLLLRAGEPRRDPPRSRRLPLAAISSAIP